MTAKKDCFNCNNSVKVKPNRYVCDFDPEKAMECVLNNFRWWEALDR